MVQDEFFLATCSTQGDRSLYTSREKRGLNSEIINLDREQKRKFRSEIGGARLLGDGGRWNRPDQKGKGKKGHFVPERGQKTEEGCELKS